MDAEKIVDEERTDELVPWAVKKEHRWAYPLAMLRAEGCRRAGQVVAESLLRRLDGWLATTASDNTVVHYDPATEEGFVHVPRREGVDLDLIRQPGPTTTPRPSAG